jgi:hypothetical protein
MLSDNQVIILSTEKKNPFIRGQALNDATSGQFGEEPVDIPENHSEMQKQEDEGEKTARKFSKNIK